jgi:hypothetical protein
MVKSISKSKVERSLVSVLGQMTLGSKVGHLKVGASTSKTVDGQVDLKVKG